ncbi:NAD(P)-dependent oxidoreductase [Jongsikchunia kroppenstedtii]|uniref:NAD(P)-dependent oxidoreductase n=1 Tax=Jongsikchunia kroppenstedtii TaxID=1121721 RepID=UPI0003624D02|nr:NAD(P)H-binding protein [Jongsikchunia kroppenstedtii]
MSTVVVFGATGFAGGHITDELVRRGHKVVAVARDTSKLPQRDVVEARSGSVDDPAFVTEVAQGADVIVSAISTKAGGGGVEFTDAVTSLLAAAEASGARLGIVGGAASLLTAPGGPRVLDAGFPDEIRPIAEEQARGQAVLENSNTDVDWFYVSPSALFGRDFAGERTGTFRVGDDVLLTGPDGTSTISGADYAIAFVDEIERPAHHQKRFTVGY